ncbi:Lanthionine biosynthesis protein LanB [Cystobacter fuscus]|uniref:Lanthionine biosynthesis protein LanB n=1 Tax=Cystobacter fuscus TaxID=43 RepID=A0A250IZY1_9BACT|nr:lantibiotic dehydratase [Cystobacter fuscus]ATB36767.1 Lanthionine biosynthesis protein LanB [Cystobacter fuscus]
MKTAQTENMSREFPFAPSGFFVLRTPLLPFDELDTWGQGLEAPRLPPGLPLEPALQRDRATLRARLAEMVRRPEVREALFVASPGFHEHLEQWERAPESEQGVKLERGLVRYLSRMAGRPTPFGLFSGYSVGELGEHTRLRTGPRERYQRHTRLDMDYACLLAEAFSRSPELRPHIPHRPSTSLYRASNQLHYAERRLAARHRAYHLMAIEPTEYLEAALARARHGVRPEELARFLVEMDPDVSLDEARGYVDELIDSQLLVSELQPPVTGPEALPELISQLRQLPGTTSLTEALGAVQSCLEHLDREGLGASSERYLDVARMLAKLPVPVELPRLFQVDLIKPAPEAVLGKEVLRELEKGVRLLHRLHPSPPEDGLEAFRDAFLQRYEGRELPLLEVLDEESGIGFMTSGAPDARVVPLLEGLALGAPREARASFGEREARLLHKLEHVQRTGSQVMELSDEDLAHLENPSRAPLPDAFMAMATVAAESEESLARGRFQVRLHMAAGPSGANVLGRFCLGDEQLHLKVRAHLRAEESSRPDAVYAEIVHLPQGRAGNILARPVLRGHELTYLGRSGAPDDRQLDASDLLISLQGRRIVLRSRRLGREVIPRMTNVHDHGARNLGLYRFLCTLATQHQCGALQWSWGPLAHARFLPRVTHGRLVLSVARWSFWHDTLEGLGAITGAQRFAAIQALRAEHRLPRFIALEEGDQLLPIDLDNVLSIDTLVQRIKDRPRVTLVELFPRPEELCAHGPEGRFHHEVVVPFGRTRPAPAEPRRLHEVPVPRPELSARGFLPGSEWLDARIYTGAATADRLMIGLLAPLVRAALASSAADGWFFTRHADPDWHLRLRFHGAPERLQEVQHELMSMLSRARRDGLVWKVQLDTYEREVERYGGAEGVRLCERLFQVDSEATLQLLELLRDDEGTEARWRLMLASMDSLLSDLGMDLDAKLRLVTVLREGLGREFHVQRATEHQLSERYRRERRGLEQLLVTRRVQQPVLTQGLAVLARRSERQVPITTALRALSEAGRLRVPLAELAGNLLHMNANRMAHCSVREQELVLHDYLRRHYGSLRARQGQTSPKRPAVILSTAI